MTNPNLKTVTNDEPCRHCGKPDWCYRLDDVEVCKRGTIADGWQATNKADTEGSFYLRIAKAERPWGQTFKHEYQAFESDRRFTLSRHYKSDGTGKKINWEQPLGDTKEADLLPYKSEIVSDADQIFALEGELQADDLNERGLPAISCRVWTDRQASLYTGRTVVIIPDCDRPGINKSTKTAALLTKHGVTVKYCYLPKIGSWQYLPDNGGLDSYDYFKLGGTVEELRSCVTDQPLQFESDRTSAKTQQSQTITASKLIPQIGDILENSPTPIDADIRMTELAQKLRIAKKDLYAYWRQHKELTNDAPLQTMSEFLKAETATQWLIGGLLPQGTTALIHASAGIGKSLLAYDLAKAVAGGTDWNGLPTQHGNVLIVQTDEPSCITRERFQEMGYSELPDNRVFYLESWNFLQLPKLEKLIAEKDIKFLVIDSLTSANRSASSEEKDSPYAHCLYDLRDISNRYQCTALVIHHSNRQGGLRGSSAIDASVSEIWRLRTGTENSSQRILEIGKSRAGLSDNYLIECNFDDGYQWQWHGEFNKGLDSPTPSNRVLEYFKLNPTAWIEAEELVGYCNGNYKSIGMALQRYWKKGLLQREQAQTAPTEQGGRKRYRYRLVGYQHSVDNHVENPEANNSDSSEVINTKQQYGKGGREYFTDQNGTAKAAQIKARQELQTKCSEDNNSYPPPLFVPIQMLKTSQSHTQQDTEVFNRGYQHSVDNLVQEFNNGGTDDLSGNFQIGDCVTWHGAKSYLSKLKGKVLTVLKPSPDSNYIYVSCPDWEDQTVEIKDLHLA